MYHYQLIRRRWPILLSHSKDLFMIEITDEVGSAVFRRIICRMYEDSPFVVLSQFVDTTQWKVGQPMTFVNGLREAYGVETFTSIGFTEGAASAAGASEFVLHVVGSPQIEMLNGATRFGMTSLPNIIYGLKEKKESWVADLLKWNAQIVRVVRLLARIDSAELLALVKERGLITITIDGHLNFLLTEVARLDKLLRLLEEEARASKLKLDLRSDDLLA